MNRLFIVVPCYNEEAVLLTSHERLSSLLLGLIENGAVSSESHILYVDDGSVDTTWDIISSLYESSPLVCGLSLAHNAGHQNALWAGMQEAYDRGCDCVVTIDADLQDDIDVIPMMLERLKEGCEVIYGVKDNRESDTWFKRVSAQAYYKIMIALGVDLVYNHADFRLLSFSALGRLLQFGERNLFLRGIVPVLSNRTATVTYSRQERSAGTSKYPLKKMLGLAVDGLTSFSTKPVKALMWMGLFFLLVACGILVYVIFSYIQGATVSGWASIMLSMWFIGGCLLLGLGIVGEYIGKIYIEVKARPRYLIGKKLSK